MRNGYIPLIILLSITSCTQNEGPSTEKLGPDEIYDPSEVDRQEQIERIETLGYLGAVEEASDQINITVYDESLAQPGYNFYVSAHDAQAHLMDMDGEVLHTWQFPFKKMLELTGRQKASLDQKTIRPVDKLAEEGLLWRRAILRPNGDLIAIYNSFGIIKLDKYSNKKWIYTGGIHHDLDADDAGNIYALGFDVRDIPDIDPENPVRDDLVIILDPDGNEQNRISIYEAIKNSPFRSLLLRIPRSGELFHSNTIQILDGQHEDTHPAFKKGNIMISLLMESTIIIINPDSQKVEWAMNGTFRYQHEPTMLKNGNLLLFDNFGPAVQHIRFPTKSNERQSLWYKLVFEDDYPEIQATAVIELDLATGKESWRYQGTDTAKFYSETCGTTYRLDNGNTLIVETQFGRAFEVTPTHEIVWEFVSPHRIESKVARLFDLQRIDAAIIDAWLQ